MIVSFLLPKLSPIFIRFLDFLSHYYSMEKANATDVVALEDSGNSSCRWRVLSLTF